MSHDRILPPTTPCVEDGCDWPSVDDATGLCAVHHRNYRRLHPLEPEPEPKPEPEPEPEPVVVESNGHSNGDQPDELQELRDRAVKPMSFRRWLFNAETKKDSRFDVLRQAMVDASSRVYGKHSNPHIKMFPSLFDYETYAAAMDYDEAALENLTLAEMEWRVEKQARNTLATKMEIDTTSAFDFHSPAQTEAQFCRFKIGAGGPSGAMKFCKLPAIPGTVRCKAHGGELVDVSLRRAILMSSYLHLVEATGKAVDCLVDITLHSRNDLARVQAAREILDRAGLTTELNVTIKLEGEEKNEKMSHLREKLDSMQRGLMAQVIETTAT